MSDTLKKKASAIAKNPMTTAGAICGLIALVAQLGQALLDGNPETVPNWALISTVGPGLLGVLFARDGDKSSEDVGAK